MKIQTVIPILIFCYSCKPNSDELVCKKITSEIIQCSLEKDTSFQVYFDEQTLNLKMCLFDDGEIIQDWRVNEPLSMVERVHFFDNKKREHFELLYNSSGKLVSSTLFNNPLNESYSRKIVEKGYEYQVFHFLPEYDKRILSYYFTISNNVDTLDYFYYIMDENTIDFKTDVFDFSKNNNERDSMYIEYVFEPYELVPIDNPKDDNFYPNFSTLKENKVYNQLKIEKGHSDTLGVGVLWGFFGSRKHPYSYKMLIFNGGILNRVSKYKKMADEFEKQYYNNRIGNIKDLKEKLLNVGFVIEGNKLRKGKELNNRLINLPR